MQRRHGWQRPLHPLQIVGMLVFSILIGAFYCFLGLFLGNRIAEITVTTFFSFAALSVAFLFIRCAAIDPTDKTRFRKKRKGNSSGFSKLNYRFMFGQIVMRFFRRMERKILRTFIRRKYLDPWKTSLHMEPLILFPLVTYDDSIAPEPKEDDISFCSLCDFEVKKHSKHCRTCNRCVEGFDHHCRWLNNCVGKKNYTTFILLMIFVLVMLIIEGGTAIGIFIRCFVDRKGVEQELERRLYVKCPRGVLIAISVLLVLLIAYSSAALGQLFLFHVVLIRKGMRTYDYILAMKAENQPLELESLEDSDFSSDESMYSDSPDKPTYVSRFVCGKKGISEKPEKLSIRIDREPDATTFKENKQGFRAAIDPWKLIKMNGEKALLAADKTREKLLNQKTTELDCLQPLPLETKSGPFMEGDKNVTGVGLSFTPLISKERLAGPLRQFSSPRRRNSSSPKVGPDPDTVVASPKRRYRNNFDLKLMQVSKELETYISRQVLCSVLKKDESETSPRCSVSN